MALMLDLIEDGEEFEPLQDELASLFLSAGALGISRGMHVALMAYLMRHYEV